MKLVKVTIHELGPGQIRLSDQQIQLAQIEIDTLRMLRMERIITVVGRVVPNQFQEDAISARVPGRIDRLFTRTSGEYVRKGQVLCEIFSETLNSTQSELLLISKRAQYSNDTTSFMEIATRIRRKLLAYGMTSQQLDQVVESQQILERVPIAAPRDGYVLEKYINEGVYVNEGSVLFVIATSDEVLIEAEVYPSYTPYVHIGSSAFVTIHGVPDSAFACKVIALEPQVRKIGHVVIARLRILNSSLPLRPGLSASVDIQESTVETLALPIDAVIQGSNGSSVWVRHPNGVFEIKMVRTGVQNSHLIEIVNGLKDGDYVVSSGAYLLNSEYVFKTGASPMAGHDMNSMNGAKHAESSTHDPAGDSQEPLLSQQKEKLEVKSTSMDVQPSTERRNEYNRHGKTASIYRCPMHPEVQSSKPQSCPKCGMTLQRVGSK